MRDILFILVLIAFFALATLLVRACEWLTGEAREIERHTAGEAP